MIKKLQMVRTMVGCLLLPVTVSIIIFGETNVLRHIVQKPRRPGQATR
ncbi:MAG: hypothetical protein M0T74_07755 [Desulfitobacterium hafniense]|nr:hypothetical protein [Desulfitobacterium hafniense]